MTAWSAAGTLDWWVKERPAAAGVVRTGTRQWRHAAVDQIRRSASCRWLMSACPGKCWAGT